MRAIGNRGLHLKVFDISIFVKRDLAGRKEVVSAGPDCVSQAQDDL